MPVPALLIAAAEAAEVAALALARKEGQAVVSAAVGAGVTKAGDAIIGEKNVEFFRKLNERTMAGDEHAAAKVRNIPGVHVGHNGRIRTSAGNKPLFGHGGAYQ